MGIRYRACDIAHDRYPVSAGGINMDSILSQELMEELLLPGEVWR